MRVIKLTEKDLTKIVKRILKESLTFDQRRGYTTTNQEWLDWEKEVMKVEKELKFLGKKIYNELEELEEVLASIIKNTFDTGEVSNLGLLSATYSSLSNTPVVRAARKRTDILYDNNIKQKYLEYVDNKKECDDYRNLIKTGERITPEEKIDYEVICRKVKYTPIEIKKYLEIQEPKNIETTENSIPKWYYIIQRTRNEIRESLYQGPAGLSINMWKLFLNNPLIGNHPLPKIPNLEFLKHSLDEMPKKISNILKEKIPQNQSKEMKKIVELREKYEDLLQTQPVHFVK